MIIVSFGMILQESIGMQAVDLCVLLVRDAQTNICFFQFAIHFSLVRVPLSRKPLFVPRASSRLSSVPESSGMRRTYSVPVRSLFL